MSTKAGIRIVPNRLIAIFNVYTSLAESSIRNRVQRYIFFLKYANVFASFFPFFLFVKMSLQFVQFGNFLLRKLFKEKTDTVRIKFPFSLDFFARMRFFYYLCAIIRNSAK